MCLQDPDGSDSYIFEIWVQGGEKKLAEGHGEGNPLPYANSWIRHWLLY